MQEMNIVTNTYWSNNERFADIMNVGLFGAEKVLSANQLSEKDGYLGALQGKDKKKNGIQKYRDVAKKADFNTTFVLLGLENQSDIHYSMPAKVMGYEYLGYDKQLKEIKREHQERKDLKGAEFLSGFSKEDRLSPICTLVLYYGKEPWDGPTHLKQILNLEGMPKEVQEKVVDYPIHIVDVRRFKDSEKLETDARILFGFMQRDGDKEELQRYCEENQDAFQNITDDTYEAIATLTNSKGMLSMKEENRNQEGGIDMCKALQDWMEESRENGKLEMKIEMILELLAELGPVPKEVKEKIMSQTDMEVLSKWFKLAVKSDNIQAFVNNM